MLRALLLLCGALLAVASAASAPEKRPEPASLKLATWNLEWLVAPEIFRPLKGRCAPANVPVGGNERRLPCDVAYRRERSSSDFAALARYARQLDADVIALQEVDGPQAARLVFHGYEFCFTGRRHLQNNGFAIRAGLPFHCGKDLRDLSRRDAVRRGAELVLFPGEPHELRLLSVHLKAGCNRGPLNEKQACRQLAEQVEPLERWIDAQARAGKRFAVLGDFNRDLLREAGRSSSPAGRRLHLWPEIDDGDPPEADLVNAAEGQPFLNCTPGQAYTGYIDYVVLSRSLGAASVPGSFERLTYQPLDARRHRLADHCPVAVRVRLHD